MRLFWFLKIVFVMIFFRFVWLFSRSSRDEREAKVKVLPLIIHAAGSCLAEIVGEFIIAIIVIWLLILVMD